jgi:hypothetical protein
MSEAAAAARAVLTYDSRSIVTNRKDGDGRPPYVDEQFRAVVYSATVMLRSDGVYDYKVAA